jgi:ankyrin repeat protein
MIRPPSKLHELALEGDAKKLEQFLSSSEGKAIQIDQRDSYGYSAIHLATDRGMLTRARVLHRARNDPLVLNTGHLETVRTLLAHGADKQARVSLFRAASHLEHIADSLLLHACRTKMETLLSIWLY